MRKLLLILWVAVCGLASSAIADQSIPIPTTFTANVTLSGSLNGTPLGGALNLGNVTLTLPSNVTLSGSTYISTGTNGHWLSATSTGLAVDGVPIGSGSGGGGSPAWSSITGTPTSLAGYGITDPVILSTGSYSNPAWITALAYSKLTGAPTTWAWGSITGTPTTLSGYGITDPTILSTGSYNNPAWITGLAYSKITGAPSFEPAITGSSTDKYWRGDKTWQTLDTSVVPENGNLYFTAARVKPLFSGTGGVSYNSSTGVFSITNGWFSNVAISGSFADLLGKPTTLSGYGITDPLLTSTGTYNNPGWLASLSWSKLTGVPGGVLVVGGTNNISTFTVGSNGTLGSLFDGAGNANYADSANETDPVFSAWLASVPNVSTFTNDEGYLTTESDPVFSAWLSGTKILYDQLSEQSLNFASDTQSDYSSLVKIDPDYGWVTIQNATLYGESGGVQTWSINAAGLVSGLSGFTEADPLFEAWLATSPNISTFTNDAGYITTAAQVGDNVSEFVNDAGYLTSLSGAADGLTIDSLPISGLFTSGIANTALNAYYNDVGDDLVATVGNTFEDVGSGVYITLGATNGGVALADGLTGGEQDPVWAAWLNGSATGGFDGDVYFALQYGGSSINLSWFNNDAGYVTNAAQVGDNVSEFTNDAGYITSESDPVFTAWMSTGPELGDITSDVNSIVATAGYLTLYQAGMDFLSIDFNESDPVFTAWLAGSPSVSTFGNDVPYMALVGAPATSTSPGATNQIATDGTFIYICPAPNTWVRAAVTTF